MNKIITVYFFDDYGYYQGQCGRDALSVMPGNSTAAVPQLVEGTVPRFVAGAWINVPTAEVDRPESAVPQRPRLVITGIECSDLSCWMPALDDGEVTCREGATTTAAVELQDAEGQVIPLTDSFRMPVQARDGREFVVLASFQDGVAQIAVPFRESGVWQITEAMINSGLPPEAQMTFAGLTIFVVV